MQRAVLLWVLEHLPCSGLSRYRKCDGKPGLPIVNLSRCQELDLTKTPALLGTEIDSCCGICC